MMMVMMMEAKGIIASMGTYPWMRVKRIWSRVQRYSTVGERDPM